MNLTINRIGTILDLFLRIKTYCKKWDIIIVKLTIYKIQIIIVTGRKKMIKEALKKKLEGDIEVAKADLKVFLANPIGVAEHIDYVVTAEKKLEILAHAEDKLESLLKL